MINFSLKRTEKEAIKIAQDKYPRFAWDMGFNVENLGWLLLCKKTDSVLCLISDNYCELWDRSNSIRIE